MAPLSLLTRSYLPCVHIISSPLLIFCVLLIKFHKSSDENHELNNGSRQKPILPAPGVKKLINSNYIIFWPRKILYKFHSVRSKCEWGKFGVVPIVPEGELWWRGWWSTSGLWESESEVFCRVLENVSGWLDTLSKCQTGAERLMGIKSQLNLKSLSWLWLSAADLDRNVRYWQQVQFYFSVKLIQLFWWCVPLY